MCKEGMWEQFLSKVSLIDDVQIKCMSRQQIELVAEVLPLGQLRVGKSKLDEKLSISWKLNDQTKAEWDGKLRIPMDLSSAIGEWTFRVQFESSMIRKNIPGTVRERKFKVTAQSCA